MSGHPRVGALIVDDEADLRLLVRLSIDAHNQGLFVWGEAESGAMALEAMTDDRPDVVVLDQMMPGMDGLETTVRMLELHPGQRIVMFSAFLDDELERQASSAGISACLLKSKANELAPLLLDVAGRHPA